MKTETVKEWVNRIVAESTPDIPEGTGTTATFRLFPYQQAAMDYVLDMTPEKRLYLQKVRALAERIAKRAGVTKPKVACPVFSDFLACKRVVFRKVFLPRGLSVIASVHVDEVEVYNPLNGGPEHTLDELLPIEEARFAMVNYLMQRTPYIRPRLPR